MKKSIAFLCLIMTTFLTMNAQDLRPLAQEILLEQSKGVSFQVADEVFTERTQRVVNLDAKFIDPSQVTYLNYDFSKLPAKGQSMNLMIPYGKRTVSLLLVELTDIPEPIVTNEKGEKIEASTELRFYRGIIEDDPNSLVAITFQEDNIMGIVSDSHGNYELGKSRDHNVFLFFSDSNKKTSADFHCEVPSSPIEDFDHGDTYERIPTAPGISNCVNVYFETEFDMFVTLGGEQRVKDYVRAMFHQVAVIYYNENIAMKISYIMVWTVNDPYTSRNGFDLLQEYMDESSLFIGDIAQLLTFRTDGGLRSGWANTDTLCDSDPDELKSIAQIEQEYESIPDLSWTIYVVAHELAHTIGSPHTRACVWNGNNTAIDACGGVQGTCEDPEPPLGGGTIMSLCTPFPFANGFGAQPGNLLRSRVANASCLSSCNVTCRYLCDLQPEIQVVPWFTNSNPCSYKFIGSNFLSPMCDILYDYEWRIEGLLPVASTSKEFIYDFSSWDNGTYDITLEMTYEDPDNDNCTYVSDRISIPVTINCGINNSPTCPTNSFFINEVEPCLDYQVTMMTDSGVASIDWSYSICGLPGEQTIGITTGPNHSDSFTLPAGIDYDNCYLWIHADINLTNGVVCEKNQSMLLDCPGGSGGSKIVLVPNPTTGTFNVKNASEFGIASIEIRNLQGVTVASRSVQLEKEFNLLSQAPGVYLVRIIMKDGSTVIKKLILDK